MYVTATTCSTPTSMYIVRTSACGIITRASLLLVGFRIHVDKESDLSLLIDSIAQSRSCHTAPFVPPPPSTMALTRIPQEIYDSRWVHNGGVSDCRISVAVYIHMLICSQCCLSYTTSLSKTHQSPLSWTTVKSNAPCLCQLQKLRAASLE